MLAGSGTPPPEENPTERKYNFLLPQSRSPAYWPVISAGVLIKRSWRGQLFGVNHRVLWVVRSSDRISYWPRQ
jgi:hypothetical protein